MAFVLVPTFAQTDPATAGYGFGSSVTESGLLVLPLSVFMLVVARRRVDCRPPTACERS